MRTLTSLLAVAGCLALASPALAQDALKTAPADAFAMIHVDVQAVLGSQLFKDLAGPLQASPDYQEALKEMKAKGNFNPEKDLSAITIYVAEGAKGGKPVPTVVAHGTFDAKTIMAMGSKEAGMTQKTAGGVSYLLSAKDKMGLAITKNTAVMGSEAHLPKAIKGAGGNAKLASLAKGVKTGDAIWFTLNMPASMMAQLPSKDPNAKALRSARGSLSLANGGMGLSFMIGMADKAAAGNVTKLLNEQLSKAAGDPAAAQMGFADMIKKAKVVQKGNDIVLDLALGAPEIQKLKMLMGMMMMGMGGQKAAPGAPGK